MYRGQRCSDALTLFITLDAARTVYRAVRGGKRASVRALHTVSPFLHVTPARKGSDEAGPTTWRVLSLSQVGALQRSTRACFARPLRFGLPFLLHSLFATSLTYPSLPFLLLVPMETHTHTHTNADTLVYVDASWYRRSARRWSRGRHEERTPQSMGGALAASRVLRCFLLSKDAEALLQSVLEHHGAAEGPSVNVAADTLPPEQGNKGEAPSFGPPSCLLRNPDNAVTELRAGEEASVASAVGGDELKDPSQLTRLFSTSQHHQQSDCSRGHAGQNKSTSVPADQVYFTLETVRAHPMISFPEILTQWEQFLAFDGDKDADHVSQHLCCSEMALLNLKLEDGLLASLAAMCGTPPPIDKVPRHVADALRSDFCSGNYRKVPGALHVCRAPLSHPAPKSPACYTLLHFSAELGDVAYVQALLAHYPSGFPLRWLSSPMHAGQGYPTPAMLAVEEPARGVGF